MTGETFRSGGKDFKITVFPAPGDGKRHPIVLLIHGNFGLGPPYGDQIRGFGKSLAQLGYVAAVPQLYEDDAPHPNDIDPDSHVETLSAAIAKSSRPPGRRSGSGGARRLLAGCGGRDDVHRVRNSRPGQGDGRLLRSSHRDDARRSGAIPPTIIFHNEDDEIVRAVHTHRA